ncbi:MAG: hypothetical protein ABI895_32545 [Deltaproteobacteria bacterium]
MPKVALIATRFFPDVAEYVGLSNSAWHRYTLRSHEIDIIDPAGLALAMIRLPRFAFFAYVGAEKRSDQALLSEFELDPIGGSLDLSVARECTPVALRVELSVRAQRTDVAINQMSERQRDRTSQSLRNIGFETVLASDAGAAALFDLLKQHGIDPEDALGLPCPCGGSAVLETCHGARFAELIRFERCAVDGK